MTRSSDSADSPLTAADPRISEWLDDRLPPAAAAEVERAVRGSPELTRLVDDLLAIRGALRSLPVAEPPAGFSGRVTAAAERRSLAAVGGREGGQSPVGDSPRRRPGIWRAWPALAAALAAGVLVAIVLNVPGLLPGPGDREVALGPALRETADDARTPVTREDENRAARVAAAPAPASGAASAPAAVPGRPAADENAKRQTSVGSQNRGDAGLRKANEKPAEALGAEADRADALAMAAPAEPVARRTLATAEAPSRPAAAAAPDEAAATAEKRGLPQPRQAVAGVLAIEVGSTSSRQSLDRLVAGSGLEVTRAGERLELVGPAAATNAFLGELERAGLLQVSPRREAKGLAGGGDQPVRLIIRLVVPKRQPTADESRP